MCLKKEISLENVFCSVQNVLVSQFSTFELFMFHLSFVQTLFRLWRTFIAQILLWPYRIWMADWFSICYQLPLLSASQVVVTHEEIMCWCEGQGQHAARARVWVAMIWAPDSCGQLLSHAGPISLLPFFKICFHFIKSKQTTWSLHEGVMAQM